MGRLLNRSLTPTVHAAATHSELREETRHVRLLPLLFTPVLETEDELVEKLSPAVSQDVSSEGFSMLAYGAVESDTILAIITDPMESALLHCEIRHVRHIGYGYYLHGIKVLEKLRWGPFAKLREAVGHFNDSFEPNILQEAAT